MRELSIERWRSESPIFLHSASHNRRASIVVSFDRDGAQNYGTSLVFYEKLSMPFGYLFMNHRNQWSRLLQQIQPRALYSQSALYSLSETLLLVSYFLPAVGCAPQSLFPEVSTTKPSHRKRSTKSRSTRLTPLNRIL